MSPRQGQHQEVQQFRDWLIQGEAKMEFLNITESKRKVAYLRSNAGP